MSVVLASGAQAADWAWSTAPVSSNFADNNWTSGTTPGAAASAPASGDGLYFGASSITALNNNFSGFSFAGITFNPGANAFVITNNAFTLTGGITNNSSVAQVIQPPIVFSGNVAIVNKGGATLTIFTNLSGAGNLTLNGDSSGAISLATRAVGGINFAGSIVNSGTGSGAVNIGGASAATAYVGSSITSITQNSPTSPLTVFGGNSAYLGGVTINAGTANVINSAASGGAAGFIHLGATSGSAAASLFIGSGANNASPITVRAGSSGVKTMGWNSGGGTTMTYSGNLTVNDDVTLLQGSGNSTVGVVFSTNMTVAANKTVTLRSVVAASTQLTISGSVRSADSSSKIVLSAGGGRLSGSNTFSGTVQTLPNSGALALNNTNAVKNATLDTGAAVGTQSVTFTVAGANTYNIGALQGADDLDIGANSIVVGSKAVDTSFSGVLSGSGALTKIGTGTLALSGANTYSGDTTINAGKLVGAVGSTGGSVLVASTAGNSATLGVSITDNTMQWNASSLSFNNAGTGCGLDINFGFVTPSASTALLNISGNADFTSTPTVTVALQAINVTASTSYPLIAFGSSSGTLPTAVTIITAPRDTVTGHLTVVGSTLYLVIDTVVVLQPLSWATGSGTWDNNNSGNLVWKDFTSATTYYQPGDVVVFNNTIGSGGTVTLDTTVSPLAVTVNPTTAYTISGTGSIAGSAAFTKSGAGTLTLATTNTYSGGTTLAAGQLNINNGGSGPANSAIGTGPLNIAGASTIDNTSGADVTLLPAIPEKWNADFTYVGSASSLDLGAGSVVLGASRQITVSARTLTVGGGISDGGNSFSLTKAGAGSLTLSGAGSYSGGTTISAGTLNTGVAGGLGAGPVTVDSGAALNLTGGAVNYTGPNTGISGAGIVNFALGTGSGSTFLNGNNSGFTGTLNIGTNGLTGVVAGPGAGKIQLNGVLDSTATVNVLSNASVYVSSAVSQNATIKLNGGDTGESLGQLRLDNGATWSGPVMLAGPITGAGDGNVGCNTGIGDISGIISGAQSLIKVGAGTIVLSGANTYTGNTTVSAGSLFIVNPNINTNSTVTVANGAVLNLAFAETNQVAALVLGGTNQAPGVYSVTTSAPYIDGAGSLLVVPGIAMNPTNIILTVTGSNTLDLSWPATHLGWLVQSNSLSLAVPGNWYDITNTATGTNFSITIDTSKPNVFYRLRKP